MHVEDQGHLLFVNDDEGDPLCSMEPRHAEDVCRALAAHCKVRRKNVFGPGFLPCESTPVAIEPEPPSPATPTEERRVLALERENRRLRDQIVRLDGWLALIEGGDNPCNDAKALRQMAYQALTLAADVPDRWLARAAPPSVEAESVAVPPGEE